MTNEITLDLCARCIRTSCAEWVEFHRDFRNLIIINNSAMWEVRNHFFKNRIRVFITDYFQEGPIVQLQYVTTAVVYRVYVGEPLYYEGPYIEALLELRKYIAEEQPDELYKGEETDDK